MESEAQGLYDSFSEGAREYSRRKVKVPPPPAVLADWGKVVAIEYENDRTGKNEVYRHKFKKPAKGAPDTRPTLCTDPKGRRLYFVGGRYKITEKGIVG